MIVERLVPGDIEWRKHIASHLQRYRFASQFVRGKRVLDAGCGVGYGCSFLAKAGALDVVGVDIDKDALALAEERFAYPSVRFIRDDCQAMDLVEGRFDVIIALESFEHFADVRRFLGRVAQLLCPGGVFVCSTPNGDQTCLDNPFHVKEYTYGEFEEVLREFFSDVTVLGQHWSAAYLGLQRLASVLWSSPFVRLGRWAQRLRGRPIEFPIGVDPPTEADLIISEANPELAWTFVAVCRRPRMDIASGGDR